MDTDNRTIKVLVVDDHPVVAEGTVALLSNEPRILVVGTAKNGEECLELVGLLEPDVVLLDINLPDICGVDLAEKLREIQTQMKVIMFTGQNPQEYVNSSLAKGAGGFLLKDCSAKEMAEAVLRVFEGEVYYSKSLDAIVESLNTNQKIETEPFSLLPQSAYKELTAREIEVMELVAKGMQNQEIADQLGITKRTIVFHVGNIFSKFGVSSRVEAVIAWEKSNKLY